VIAGITLPLVTSSLFLILGGGEVALNIAPPVHRSRASIKAYEWLAENVTTGDVVLASVQEGNVLPAWAPVRVLVGHGPESVAYEDMLEVVKSIYSAETSIQDRESLLDFHDIRYVFYGPQEQEVSTWSPETSGLISIEYDRAGYKIFKVVHAQE
jgi:hypothetical protein